MSASIGADSRAHALTVRIGGVPRAAIAIGVSLVMIVAMLLVPQRASAATVAESEPNDTVATADAVALGDTITGTTHAQTRIHSTDPDFFAFDVPAAGRINLDFRFPAVLSTSEVYSLRVYAASGDVLYAWNIRGTDTTGTQLAAQSAYIPAGRTYVEVRAWEDGVAGGKSYTLRPTVTTGVVETEFNDTIATADVVPLGTAISGSMLSPKITTNTADNDYFAVDIAKAGLTTIDFRFPAGLGSGDAYKMTVLDTNGDPIKTLYLAGRDSEGATLRQTPLALNAGRVYIVLRAFPGSVAWGKTYTLKLSQTERLSGADRYETSASVSRGSFSPGVPVAYVASGAGFADALSGAPVAGLQKGPVLLSTASSIPAVISKELTRLKPARIVVLGGTGVISASVLTQLKTFTTGAVTRLAGDDRYATSAAISASAFSAGVPVAYIAAGADFPDALAGAPLGTVAKAPVLLTAAGKLPPAIAAELTRLKPKKIVILGTTASIGAAVATSLKAYTAGAVTRVAGADRYATPAAISASVFTPGVPVVYVANGAQFPDALSGAPVAGMQRGPILLVTATAIPAAVATELTRLKPKRIVILGGAGAVNDKILGELGRYIIR
ncbi:cell wall-binding repeat-containing protein [Microbacterium saperdae]|uniref:Putative cell wall binding repeat protein n=1 Tax=Microbacterium saperdae TaxID=69368 RepID=A0A543BJG0_9MICO|nr:cell wall-binding repeat-containing protein [Microbacterium saperdae]TQL84956.1 putative cell wall binding repeat protein [Microbacterium saperdae]GGM58103.1 hypothetical protein GCM10010489_32160 [Microbacterium saperdae]